MLNVAFKKLKFGLFREKRHQANAHCQPGWIGPLYSSLAAKRVRERENEWREKIVLIVSSSIVVFFSSTNSAVLKTLSPSWNRGQTATAASFHSVSRSAHFYFSLTIHCPNAVTFASVDGAEMMVSTP
jgi:hypothetical protein